jgi:hypothetical protein
MLPLTPQLLVSSAITLAAREYHRKTPEPIDDRVVADAARGDASLRFVHLAGFWSHFAPERRCSSWPLPCSKRLEELTEFAEEHGGLSPRPTAGDVFLLGSSSADRHVLAGVVAAVETVTTMLDGCLAYVCTTIEGEIGAPARDVGTLRAGSVRLVRRRLSPAFGDCFIRWCDLVVPSSHAAEHVRAPLVYEAPEDAFTFKRGRRAPQRRKAA